MLYSTKRIEAEKRKENKTKKNQKKRKEKKRRKLNFKLCNRISNGKISGRLILNSNQ